MLLLILAGTGPLGFGAPRLCVEVKRKRPRLTALLLTSCSERYRNSQHLKAYLFHGAASSRMCIRSWQRAFSRCACGFEMELYTKTGPSISRSEKRPILGHDFGGGENSLVEEIPRTGPKCGVFYRFKLNKTNNLDCVAERGGFEPPIEVLAPITV